MAKSTQPNHIIICDASAFRALRCERRRCQSLGWTPLSSREIQLAVSRSSANADCIDYDLLEQLGVWSPGEKLHLLVGSSAKRRYTKPVYPHALAKPLPAGSLYSIAPGIDVLSPTMIATQYASRHSFGQTYAFFEELCSEITLAEPGYEEWLPGDIENDMSTAEDDTSNKTVPIPIISCFKSEPTLSPSDLTNWLKKVNYLPGLKQAHAVAPYVLGNARSPM